MHAKKIVKEKLQYKKVVKTGVDNLCAKKVAKKLQ
jgi:hypothetical protein